MIVRWRKADKAAWAITRERLRRGHATARNLIRLFAVSGDDSLRRPARAGRARDQGRHAFFMNYPCQSPPALAQDAASRRRKHSHSRSLDMHVSRVPALTGSEAASAGAATLLVPLLLGRPPCAKKAIAVPQMTQSSDCPLSAPPESWL